jgi:DNA (cytosine-5)-methyltransferase 1
MEKSFENAHNSKFRDNCLTFADFYDGIGGFRLGLEKLGWHCVFSNENNPDCVAIYNFNFRDSIEPHNIENFPLERIPDFDVFCGGFPCQPFSRAGKKNGLQDSRGKAIDTIIKICYFKQPKVVFLENVSHIVQFDRGRVLENIIREFQNIGYISFYSILNSKYFQIPQSRPRFFFVAFRENLGIERFDFPQVSHPEVGIETIISPGDDSIPISKKWHQYIDYYAGRISAYELSFQLPKTRIAIERSHPDVDLDNCVYQMRSNGIRAISIKRPFPTFAVSISGGGAMIPVYSKERRHLSLLEIKRLMGFPDNFHFPVSRTSAIKQLANAVCPPVIQSIGETIFSVATEG